MAVIKARISNQWVTVSSSALGSDIQPVTTITGTSYTIVASDVGKLLHFNAATAITVTVPTYYSAPILIGSHIDLVQSGAGRVTVVSEAGGTILSTPTAVLRAAGSAATLIKLFGNTWLLSGDTG